MLQVRYSFDVLRAAFLRPWRKQGRAQLDRAIARGDATVDLPDSLRSDVGLPAAVERPPPVQMTRFLQVPWAWWRRFQAGAACAPRSR